MRIIKEIQEQKTRTVLEKVICDGCGKENGGLAWNLIQWDDGAMTDDGQVITCEYNDYAAPSTFKIDICPKCFEKIVLIFNQEKQFQEYKKTIR